MYSYVHGVDVPSKNIFYGSQLSESGSFGNSVPNIPLPVSIHPCASGDSVGLADTFCGPKNPLWSVDDGHESGDLVVLFSDQFPPQSGGQPTVDCNTPASQEVNPQKNGTASTITP